MRKVGNTKVIGEIELESSQITFYEDGTAMISSSSGSLGVHLHLKSTDLSMIKDWLNSK